MSNGAPRAGCAVPEAPCGLRWAIRNARALSHSNLETRDANVEFVRCLDGTSAVLYLQHTKAKEYGLRQVLRSLEASHRILASGESDNAGGVAMLIAGTLSLARPEVTEHICGRVLEARFAQGEGVLSLFSVHNFELGNSEVGKLVAEFHRLAVEHGRAPLGRRARCSWGT